MAVGDQEDRIADKDHRGDHGIVLEFDGLGREGGEILVRGEEIEDQDLALERDGHQPLGSDERAGRSKV